MDKIVAKIVHMLSDDRPEKQCAAALVLGELRIKTPDVVEALGQALQSENRLLKVYSLQALAGARSAKVARLVTPFLDDSDEEIRTHAAALLASQGNAAAATLLKELHSGPIVRRRTAVNILARCHDEEIFAKLIDLLPDSDLGEHTLNVLRAEIDHLSISESTVLQSLASSLLINKDWLIDPTRTARCLRLLGYLRSPTLVNVLLPFAVEKKPVPVRLAALAALRRPLAASRSTDSPFNALLAVTDDPDPMIARAAIDTLRGLKVPENVTPNLLALSEARHADTRRFALEALSGTSKPRVVKRLLMHLAGDDPASRESAVRSLASMAGIARTLVKELEGSEDNKLTTMLCQVLRHHVDELKPVDQKRIIETAIHAIEEELPAAESLIGLMSVMLPEVYHKHLIAHALKLRQAKRFPQAFAFLSRLDKLGCLDDEGRFITAVTGLKSMPNKKDLGRMPRATHPVLKQVAELVANGYPITSKLQEDSDLTDEDLFYIGFNFSESKDDDEKEFGGSLLFHLVETTPRSKLGKNAKNKLRLLGLEEESYA